MSGGVNPLYISGGLAQALCHGTLPIIAQTAIGRPRMDVALDQIAQFIVRVLIYGQSRHGAEWHVPLLTSSI